ncbi:MAG: Hydantoinase/oxoprolinase family protein [uncultured Thermomicrobiales bacterium]|uniref:Hydantoinase/oxoprolinase family protein n=1 Tax=uncultured Thermomicrobiales bacterium TaxID=1645740 RepID=A0A6J4VP65_9BACT|nr:MAG: Hydantoinase/oxoprolinase family protein [uncultured Thermomicrobiales bacterium]
MTLRIGIDVGGTNTDAVLMDDARVVAKIKTPTTEDVTSGITAALRHVLETSGTATGDVAGVMIGTTHFTNAVVERRRLQPTAAVRLGLPATAALPPMVDWPADLAAVLGDHHHLCHGGHEFDGREISPFDEGEVRRAGADIAGKGISAIAVSSVFSPVNAEMEERAAEVLLAEVPNASVTLSHEIGRIGLLERENAAILNACLRPLAAQTVAAFRRAIAELGIAAPLYLTQNDGTLMSAGFAERYPVLTFASGPTNSMRGAAFLSGRKDAMVVDVGGTTSDVGALTHGFPREASVAVDIGGVRTNFRMPDVYSFGLGGGSLVREDPLRIGPRSVGYRITEQALVFGGDTLTATDVAVAAGVAEIGDPGRVRRLDPGLVRAAMERIQGMSEAAVDRMKTSAEPVPVIVVGGGSVLIARPLAGASEMVKPDHFEAANAVGAAIAQISGEVDRVYALDALTREQALDDAKAEASGRAVAAGADPATVQIVDVEDVPLAYLPGNATRVRVKAVGDLTLGGRTDDQGGSRA